LRPSSKTLLFRTVAISLGVALPLILVEVLGSIGLHYEKQQRRAEERELEERLSIDIRDRGTPTMPDPYLLYRIEPNREHPRVRTNELGLREDSMTREASAETFRVLVLGGSVAWGYTSRSNDETVSALLEDYLSERSAESETLAGRSVEVLNAGVPGYVSWQAAIAYARHYRVLEPDVIISIDGFNDTVSALDTGMVGVPLRYRNVNTAYAITRPSFFGGLGSWLRYRVQQMKIVRYLNPEHRPRLQITRLLSNWKPRTLRDHPPPPAEEVRDAYREAIEFLSDLARIDGALVVPVLQPMSTLEGTKPLHPLEVRLAEAFFAERPDQDPYFEESYALFRKMFSDLAVDRPDVLPIDATDVFENTEKIAYTDQCHLTQAGRAIFVARIGSELLERLDAAPADPPYAHAGALD
jgi:lysophospholipase L1-like esterase